MAAGKSAGAWIAGMALAATLIAGGVLGGQYVLKQRYAALTNAAEQALDAGDARTAARLALNARAGHSLAGIDPVMADSLLRDALMQGQTPLTESGEKDFPGFTIQSDTPPVDMYMAGDGSRFIILHNETNGAAHGAVMMDTYALPSLRQLQTGPYFPSEVSPVAIAGFSSDLRTTALASLKGTAFRDTESGMALGGLHIPPGFFDISVSDDRHTVAALGGDSGKYFVRTWRLTAAPVRIADFPVGDGDYELSPDGRSLAIAPSMGTIEPFRLEVWDIDSKTRKLSFSGNGAPDVAFGDGGRFLVSTEPSGTIGNTLYSVRVWNSDYRQVGAALTGLQDRVRQAALLPGAHLLALLTVGEVYLFDLRTHRLVGTPAAIRQGFETQAGWSGNTVYTLSRGGNPAGNTHRLTIYRLNPVLSFDGAALSREACRRWGAASMRLSAGETAKAGHHLALDACPA